MSDGNDADTIDSEDIVEQNKVKNYLKNIVSANLVANVSVNSNDTVVNSSEQKYSLHGYN